MDLDLLALSDSTLARVRLAREGLFFRGLLDQARRTAAVPAVVEGIPPAQVAEKLGYKEVSSFYKAFRRWTGLTPGDFRGAHLLGYPRA